MTSLSKSLADLAVEGAPWSMTAISLFFSALSLLRFLAYVRLGPGIVDWSEWMMLAAIAAFSGLCALVSILVYNNWPMG